MSDRLPLLRIENITQVFGGVVALNDVSFDVYPGEIVGLIGPNGAGKTSLFNVITGLYRPAQGSVRYGVDDPVEITHRAPNRIARLGIARTFQNLRLFGNLTVFDNVIIGRHCRLYTRIFGSVFRTGAQRREEEEAKAYTEDLLRHVGLHENAHDLASSLPYGDARRLEIARALALEPKLLLLDEPAAGMNPFETQALMEFIRGVRGHGITILLIEHDMSVVMGTSDRVVVLDHGLHIAEGKPEVIQRNPKVIEAYLGTGAEVR